MSFDFVTLSYTYYALQGGAIMLCLFRLCIRLKIGRFWWEDLWAALALIFAIGTVVVTGVYSMAHSYEPALIAGWVSGYVFTCVVWSVRMSILYSVIRIISPSTPLRKVARGIVGLFIITWAVLIALKTWWCAKHTIISLGLPTCFAPSFLVIFEMSTDVVGDAMLVLLSHRLLWKVKLPPRQRRMIISIFSSSILLSIISLAHAIAQMVGIEVAQYVFVAVESIVSLIVCNLLVVVTYAYRVLSSSGTSPAFKSGNPDDDFTTPFPRSPECLTTVDLNTPDLTTETSSHFGSTAISSVSRSTA